MLSVGVEIGRGGGAPLTVNGMMPNVSVTQPLNVPKRQST